MKLKSNETCSSGRLIVTLGETKSTDLLLQAIRFFPQLSQLLLRVPKLCLQVTDGVLLR